MGVEYRPVPWVVSCLCRTTPQLRLDYSTFPFLGLRFDAQGHALSVFALSSFEICSCYLSDAGFEVLVLVHKWVYFSLLPATAIQVPNERREFYIEFVRLK